jgi:hypothetical protein
MSAAPGHAPLAMTRPSAAEMQSLDPYAFLAVLGKRVIHPGSRRSTQQLLELAGWRPASTSWTSAAGSPPPPSRPPSGSTPT